MNQATPFGRPQHTGGPHGYVAYIPEPIPRDIEISREDLLLATEAEVALAELNGVGRLLPYPYQLTELFHRRAGRLTNPN